MPAPDGRFAPSPTGTLHLGNLRTALLAWLFARSQDARFLVRMEDLDTGRVRERFYDEQLRDLAALGLDWDGEVVRQSERLALYDDAIEALRAQHLIYECWCTRAEIREAASAPHGDLPEGFYPGTCLRLGEAERAARRASGRPPALRVRAEAATVGFEDRVAGPVSGVVDDFVVRRNDGAYAYNLAVVVDDADQRIGEVVRGADLLDSTPRQLWLGGRLGLPAPRHAHVPLMLGPDGARLAKRHGAVTLADRAAQGESAEDVVSLLAASVALAEPGERVSAAELVGRFHPRRLAAAEAAA
jgi:glutamyl-tRNA synthetase